MKRSLFLAAATVVSALSLSQPASAALVLEATPTLGTGFTATFTEAVPVTSAFDSLVSFTLKSSGLLDGSYSANTDATGGVRLTGADRGITIEQNGKVLAAFAFNTTGNKVFGAFDPVALTEGTYQLRVRGSNAGAMSSYSGTLNFAVPEPATWAMMIGGFGLVGAAARRSRKLNVTYA